MVHPGSGKPDQKRTAREEPLSVLGTDEELEGRVLRVVTLADKITIHHAFPDRGFKP
jgi:hypothetical protein